jgi:hypothetical protein
MRSLTSTFVTFALLATTTASYASDRAVPRADELRAAKERLARAARQTKGGSQQSLLLEQRRLSDLIERLGRGERVESGEVDRLLQDAGRSAR